MLLRCFLPLCYNDTPVQEVLVLLVFMISSLTPRITSLRLAFGTSVACWGC